MAETQETPLDEELGDALTRIAQERADAVPFCVPHRREKVLRFDAEALLSLLQYLDGAVIEKDGRRIRIADESYISLIREAACMGLTEPYDSNRSRRNEIAMILYRQDWPPVDYGKLPPTEELTFHSERLEDTLDSADG